jgi:UDP-hydrolysing UDP-N-acetyl-D-glucosamine 2-epimerase
MKSVINVYVTARPSWSRVKSLVLNYIKIAGPDSVVISLTGPALSNRYGNLQEVIPSGIKTKFFPTLKENSSLASVALASLDGGIAACQSWENDRPDAVLVVADRVETLGISLAAASMQIPLIHLQGGEISGSIDDKIRDTNSKLADLHLTTNERTKKNLIAMGELPENIKVVGCPSIDILNERLLLKKSIPESSSQFGGVGTEFSTNQEYGLILFHPDTLNLKENIEWIQLLHQMTENTDLNWFWFWPNPDFGSDVLSKILREYREQSKLRKIRYLRNLTPEIFMDLVLRAKVMVGNSSFGIREAAFIGLPVLNLGGRQAGRERAQNVLDIDAPRQILSDLHDHMKKSFSPSDIYGCGDSGQLAAKYIFEWAPMVKLRK